MSVGQHCRLCGEVLPIRTTGTGGRPRIYCLTCARHRPRLPAPPVPLDGYVPEPDDDPAHVIAARLAIAERAVRGRFPIEPWTMRGPRIPHEDEQFTEVNRAAKRVKGGAWGGWYPVGRRARKGSGDR